jgi:hypothetical protein
VIRYLSFLLLMGKLALSLSNGCCEGCTNLWYKRFRIQKNWVTSAIFKKYLQCILAARILTVDFVVCTLTVKKKKSGQVSTYRIGPFPCELSSEFLDSLIILPAIILLCPCPDPHTCFLLIAVVAACLCLLWRSDVWNVCHAGGIGGHSLWRIFHFDSLVKRWFLYKAVIMTVSLIVRYFYKSACRNWKSVIFVGVHNMTYGLCFTEHIQSMKYDLTLCSDWLWLLDRAILASESIASAEIKSCYVSFLSQSSCQLLKLHFSNPWAVLVHLPFDILRVFNKKSTHTLFPNWWFLYVFLEYLWLSGSSWFFHSNIREYEEIV